MAISGKWRKCYDRWPAWEADEIAISGKRKYNVGRYHTAEGKTTWSQTILEVDESPTGQRKAKRLRAFVVPSRDASTLKKNLSDCVDPSANVQTDSWAAYSGLDNHDTVNHKEKQYVKYLFDKKVTTNTIEDTHGSLKRMARTMNLFNGRASLTLKPRLEELVFRFNNREEDDLFCIFLALLASKYSWISSDVLFKLLEQLQLWPFFCVFPISVSPL